MPFGVAFEPCRISLSLFPQITISSFLLPHYNFPLAWGRVRGYDRDKQTVSVNQVVMLDDYSYNSYVVYEVSRSTWGITYHPINLRTYEFHTSDFFRQGSDKVGIGMYYDDANPKFLDPLETAALTV